ncbi:MAG: ABC transporter ATP-binding protein [Candidatus Nomurabacteria bacterium]|jgi:putative ABC transport system ATP-binding protein|nr:ABC transporter ATP-binding protein [Candidatus Nomurabacteria bacterium]
MIEMKDITKVYGDKDGHFTALKDVSFSVPDGASVAIVGKSGSGKSTLMHVISGLDRPQRGEVVIDGRGILQLSQNKIDEFRAREIAFVFQSFFIQGNESCFDNVALPLEINDLKLPEIRQRVDKALRAVGLNDKRDKPARTLSGGQKQRLAIARAIVNEPKILFADEPTGNLDSVNGAHVIETLFKYNRENGTTLFVVTHDAELAAKCDIQVQLIDGELAKITRGGRAKHA